MDYWCLLSIFKVVRGIFLKAIFSLFNACFMGTYRTLCEVRMAGSCMELRWWLSGHEEELPCEVVVVVWEVLGVDLWYVAIVNYHDSAVQ